MIIGKIKEHILTYEAGRLRVNLLLNRASPWADVDSHLPYTGQVEVRVKQPLNLAIRIPEWVTPDQVTCQVQGQPRPLTFAGRYAQVGAVQPDQVATLAFPLAEQTDTVWIEKAQYILVRKGNEVVHIEPQGKTCPLYQRAHYRVSGTRWRQIERFVPSQTLFW